MAGDPLVGVQRFWGQTPPRPNTKYRVGLGVGRRLRPLKFPQAQLRAPWEAIILATGGIETSAGMHSGGAMRRVAILLTVAGVATVAGLAAHAQSIDLPARKPGLWDMKMV